MVGDKVIDGLTLNVVTALLVPSLTSRVYAPPGIDGTTNHVVKLYALAPVVGTVVEPNVVPGVASKLA